jgi:hypothetical protein
MPEKEKKSSAVGKWMAGIASTVITAVVIWWLTNPSAGLLTPATPTPLPPTPTSSPPAPAPTPPHAPLIENTFGVPLFDERQQLISIQPGEQVHLKVMDIWSAPQGAMPSCADGFMALTWTVREPYPTGGEDLQLHSLIPRGGGRTEMIASGAQGAVTLGYCDEIFLLNTGLREYIVEIRYASGIY